MMKRLLILLILVLLAAPAASAQDGIPEPQPPNTAAAPGAIYEMVQEYIIDGYAIRLWRNAESASATGFDNIVTIQWAGELYPGYLQIEMSAAINSLTGTDVTGDGFADAVIDTYTGGAHCCFSTVIYNLTPGAPTKLLQMRPSNCPARLEDLDGDGVFEVVTCDDLFAYAYCPYAGMPFVPAILKYTPSQGYLPAGAQFPARYEPDIAAHTELAANAAPGGMGEWDNTTKCAVLPLVLDYLYAGQPEPAWAAFDQYYTYPDAAAFRQAIETHVLLSPLYRAPAPPVSDAVQGPLVLEEQFTAPPYAVRLWRRAAGDALMYEGITTLETPGGVIDQFDLATALNGLSGVDITGEGNPDVIIERFTGGAHCCFSMVVYDLGEVATKVLHTRDSECGGRFEDLDGDGVFEFLTCDDVFAYAYCPYVSSPFAKVIMQYNPDVREYIPAGAAFADRYAADIAEHTALAENTAPGEMGEWDETNKCSALPVVLDYLYSGQTEQAWAEFERLYLFEDAEAFRAEIEEALIFSDLYVIY
ncbi:MAG: hypothetical protein JXB47_20395 [Anaerolineae bacterium]|nr:hypothetical protein [Anaerolineae bacterium]